MTLFRDEDILRYLYNEMENMEVADFEATLDTQPDMQDRFEEILDELVVAQNIDGFLDGKSFQHILSFAFAHAKMDNYLPTCQTSFYSFLAD